MNPETKKPTPGPNGQLPAEQSYNLTPQAYIRIPGLIFDPVPVLIPYPHRAALDFLKPSRFKLDLSWEEYYDLLLPFNDVALKLTDVFEYCIDELKHSVPDLALAAAKAENETETDKKTAERPHDKTDWPAFFERVLDHLGSEGKGSGMGGEDVMWIAFLYTRAYDNTPQFIRARDRGYYLKAYIRYLHGLLADWQQVLREKGLRWQVVFFEIFGAD